MLLINPFIFGVFYYLPVIYKTTNVSNQTQTASNESRYQYLMRIHPQYTSLEYLSNTLLNQCGNKRYHFVTLKNKQTQFDLVVMICHNSAPVVSNHGKLRGLCPRPWRGIGAAQGPPLYALLGLGARDPRAWHRKGEGGMEGVHDSG